jgi:hypothetical protein
LSIYTDWAVRVFFIAVNAYLGEKLTTHLHQVKRVKNVWSFTFTLSVFLLAAQGKSNLI